MTAGGGVARATAVGDDSYAARLTAEAKQFRAPKSETAKGIDRILGFVTWAIIPAAVMLYFGQRASDDEIVHDTLLGIVAGVVALVPQGLVLLLSMAQTVAVIRLGRKQVLVQRLQAVETSGPGHRARIGQDRDADDRRGDPREGRAVGRRRQPSNRTATGQSRPRSPRSPPPTSSPTPTMKAIQAAQPATTRDGRSPAGSRSTPPTSTRRSSSSGRGVWYVGAPEVLLAA